MSGIGVVGIVETLARASVEGALFVAAVWLVCRLVPRLPAAVRCGLWWAACLKLLLGLAGLPAVRLPLLPAAGPAPAARVSQLLPISDPGVPPEEANKGRQGLPATAGTGKRRRPRRGPSRPGRSAPGRSWRCGARGC